VKSLAAVFQFRAEKRELGEGPAFAHFLKGREREKRERERKQATLREIVERRKYRKKNKKIS
jgi:hypothetical protein